MQGGVADGDGSLSFLSITAVISWIQMWRIGSDSEGMGVYVQTNDLYKYINRAQHCVW